MDSPGVGRLRRAPAPSGPSRAFAGRRPPGRARALAGSTHPFPGAAGTKPPWTGECAVASLKAGGVGLPPLVHVSFVHSLLQQQSRLSIPRAQGTVVLGDGNTLVT